MMPERHRDQRGAYDADCACPPGEFADLPDAIVSRGGGKTRVVPAHSAILPAPQTRRPRARILALSLPSAPWEGLQT
jgi:hypothetical protein